MNLEIDSRESAKRKEAAYSYFINHDYDVSVKQLPIGDFIFDKKVIFEYKTPSDFINSVKDGRVFRQAKRMKQYPYSYVLLSGDVFREVHERYENPQNSHYWRIKNGKEKEFTINNLLGALSKLHSFTNVIVVENHSQAFTIMRFLVEKVLNENNDVESIEIPVSQMTDSVGTFLCCCNGVSVKKAVWIKNQLKLESLEDLLNLTHEDLTSVKGIGSKTAASIMGALKT